MTRQVAACVAMNLLTQWCRGWYRRLSPRHAGRRTSAAAGSAVPDRLHMQILADLEQAGFAQMEQHAVCHTPAMWQQLVQFYRRGGRVHGQPAHFSAANGSPECITIYVPPDPAQRDCSDFATLAHELGHALFCPEQWREIASFASADAYAHSREMGEAHAWLNQYRLCLARADGDDGSGTPPMACVLHIENDHDFGTHSVDVFERIRTLLQAGTPEQAILQELAILNANMFPSGMGEGNFKTYGQCNRWDYLLATARGKPGAFQHFLDALPRPPTANEQKLLMKFNQFTAACSPLPADAALPAPLRQLASHLAQLPQVCALDDLYQCAAQALPHAELGIGRHACRRTTT